MVTEFTFKGVTYKAGRDVLFKTIHGSHLYGMSNAGSDVDFFFVVPTRQDAHKFRKSTKQSIVGDEDITVMDHRSFMKLAEKGVPQVLEAMFSRKAEYDFFEEFRLNWFCSDSEVIKRYLKTVKSFVLTENERKKVKFRRHALRLLYNLDEILHTGQFNPELPANFVKQITEYSQYDDASYARELKAISPIELEFSLVK